MFHCDKWREWKCKDCWQKMENICVIRLFEEYHWGLSLHTSHCLIPFGSFSLALTFSVSSAVFWSGSARRLRAMRSNRSSVKNSLIQTRSSRRQRIESGAPINRHTIPSSQKSGQLIWRWLIIPPFAACCGKSGSAAVHATKSKVTLVIGLVCVLFLVGN